VATIFLITAFAKKELHMVSLGLKKEKLRKLKGTYVTGKKVGEANLTP
jgi:hypothetical protein